jgi:hypothetical protein
LLSLGAVPMYGFTMMVRPDALADLLGLAGFLLTGGRRRGTQLAGVVLLVLAILTKQTAGLYLVAATLALGLEGDWRRALAGFGACLAGLLLVVLAVNVLFEPHFADSLAGERIMPWSYRDWRTLLDHILYIDADQLLLPAVGLVLWLRERPRAIRPAVLTVALLAGALGLSGKVGADTNYYLGLRVPEALAVGALWQAVHASAGRTTLRMIAQTVVLAAAIAAIALGLVAAAGRTSKTDSLARSYTTPEGQRFLASIRSAIALARDPGVPLLSDSGLLDLYQGERATFGDPWLFQTLVELGKIRPTRLLERIDAQYYDVIITGHDLDSPRYLNEDFRLPGVLRDHARAHYVRREVRPGFFYYGRRGGIWPPPSFSGR